MISKSKTSKNRRLPPSTNPPLGGFRTPMNSDRYLNSDVNSLISSLTNTKAYQTTGTPGKVLEGQSRALDAWNHSVTFNPQDGSYLFRSSIGRNTHPNDQYS